MDSIRLRGFGLKDSLLHLFSLAFFASQCEIFVYNKNVRYIFVLIYVGDILLTGTFTTTWLMI